MLPSRLAARRQCSLRAVEELGIDLQLDEVARGVAAAVVVVASRVDPRGRRILIDQPRQIGRRVRRRSSPRRTDTAPSRYMRHSACSKVCDPG